jgi:hypothetical protein
MLYRDKKVVGVFVFVLLLTIAQDRLGGQPPSSPEKDFKSISLGCLL